MAEVEVIKAVEGPILRKRDYEGKPLVITRQRVAAYVRVSTDGDEQLESFQSQKQYYQDKISENRDWVMVGIYADEAITGTKVDKGMGTVLFLMRRSGLRLKKVQYSRRRLWYTKVTRHLFLYGRDRCPDIKTFIRRA